ncbi:uncharacterized protein LOC100169299 [Acyrthosiphon pisum]|uniref:Uncharacterized protein n=1 Tax=Acyrthosiphon pisum TaxID=7029 RepID=A0A8R2FB23_ACYPI|nr:uncharacterized protein LOC100169299 [Acyrthosiphon pisum]|eukprot:XP_008186132.1 PREDICTED: uncharacterized protein LOC100169299 [Acyrthosiphon pisum]
MIYKSNKLLYVINLIFIHILVVSESTILFHRHEYDAYTDFDITTIYRVTDIPSFNSNNGTFNGINSVIEIHSRTNAIGMPIQDNADDIHTISMNIKEIIDLGSFQNNSRMSTSYNSNDWNQQNIDLDGYRGCSSNVYRTTDSENQLNKCYNAFEYYSFGKCLSDNYTRYDLSATCNFFKFYWTPDKDDQTCLTMTYYTRYNSADKPFFITMDVNNEYNNTLILSTVLEQYNGITTLKITNIDFKNNQEYKLSLKLTTTDRWQAERVDQYFAFGLIRIAQCSNYDEEDVRIISVDHVSGKKPKPFNILGNRIVEPSNYQGSCLNGGYSIKQSSKCICPPGFKGQFCETGCGVNSYGSDCKGVCSIWSDKMCRGMFMCTSYGCTCPAGLTGPSCNEDCTMGTYGADCRQTCSEHCLNNMCDQYTGVCLYGCSVGYILPYCREKYPYFINPPTLRFADYDTIELELDFQENNIKGGDKIIKPKYYQLFYKSLIENTFRTSEIKPISNTNNVTLEVIRDLESDTKFMVGVLLIADDGDFNEQSIVYGQYKTQCMQPQITDYNIKLMRGIQSINITWSISISNRLECNITKYVLTLMSNQSQNQISDVQEILSSTDSGHVLDNLLPGFKYNIKLTPSTSNGTMPSSPIYSITTLMTKNGVQIKNISTIYENGKIKVNWILVNSHQHYTTVDEPVTSIIKYKVKRILSCSIREVEQNWTSITIFNQTNYEIFDTVPNSQYSIQVLVGIEDKITTQQENMINVLTPASSPISEPILDPDHPMCITYNSIFVQWKIDPENCSKLNGFLSQFYIELKNKVDDVLQTRETKNNYISFNELKFNTDYELKVFIKTHFGYNPEHFLLANFKTKLENLKPVEDLVVYKKSLKNRMAGFRWRYSQDTNVDGFIVSFDENPLINTKNVSIIPPQKCSAWPEYYCHTFYNLSPSNNYTFKIKPKSIDYPEGGKVLSIFFNSIDGLPDSPMNFKTTEIGSTTLALQWDAPWIFNGVLKMFIINVEEISSNDMNTCCVSITPTEIPVNEELPTYNYTITGLQPGSTYSIGVLSVSKSLWYSSPSRLSVTLPNI